MPAPTLNLETVQTLMTAQGVDGASDLAKRIEWTGGSIERSYLSRILRGQRPAKPSHIVAIARALKCPPIALVGPADPDVVALALTDPDDNGEAVA